MAAAIALLMVVTAAAICTDDSDASAGSNGGTVNATTGVALMSNPHSDYTKLPSGGSTSVVNPTARCMVYGNVDNDDDIDNDDLTALKALVSANNWNPSRQPYADVNYDGKVNSADVTYLEAILNGDKVLLYYMANGPDAMVTKRVNYVHYPIQGAIGVNYEFGMNACSVMGIYDDITAGTEWYLKNASEKRYPGISGWQSLGFGYNNGRGIVAETAMATHVSSIIGFTRADQARVLEAYNESPSNQFVIDSIELRFGTVASNGASMIDDLITAGCLYGCQDAVLQYADFYDANVAKIASYTSKMSPAYTFVCAYNTDNSVTTYVDTKDSSSGSQFGDDYTICLTGMKDLYYNVQPSNYYEVNIEDIIAKNPDVIVISLWGKMTEDTTPEEGQKMFDEVAKYFKATSAYKNKQIYGVNFETIGTFYGVSQLPLMASYIWPSNFSEEDGWNVLKECYADYSEIDTTKYDVTQMGSLLCYRMAGYSVAYYDDTPILWVRGNVDGDHDIDAKDLGVLQAIIDAKGTYSKYPWADANGDGKIDNDDMVQLKAMIDGTAQKIYYQNIDGKVCSFVVRDEINAVPVNKCQAEDILMVMNVDDKDRIVGGDQQCYKYNNELALTWVNSSSDVGAANIDPSKGVVCTGTKNGETQAEIISLLEKHYGHIEICLGSSSSYGTNLETDFANDPNVSVIRLPSWESKMENGELVYGALNGVMTYGYLFGGVQKDKEWDQALKYYDWYMGYYKPIVEAAASIPTADRPTVLVTYVEDCYPGATNKVLAETSGDYEYSVLCGGNNIGNKFGTGYVSFTKEDLAAYAQNVDYFIAEPSGVYGDGGKQYVIDAVQKAIDVCDGYMSTSSDIYSLSFMVTSGPGVPVAMATMAKMFYPDNATFASIDSDKAWAEYLALIGWDKRTDVSDIVSSGPGHTKTPVSGDVPVTGISLNQSSVTVKVGGTAVLTATVSPSNATNQKVNWTTSNPAVATVSNGVVSAVATGTAVITATTVDGGKTATCTVTVGTSDVPVTGVSLDKASATMKVGDSAKLTATVSPAGATDKAVTWTTSNKDVATVDSNGNVKAVSAGSATITVSTHDGGKTASCTVTVQENSSGSDNTMLYVGIAIVALVIVALLALFFMRKNKSA